MSFTSGTFLAPRVLYIKCTTCFSRYATRFCVICIIPIRVLMSQPRVYGKYRAISYSESSRNESSPRVREILVVGNVQLEESGVIPTCTGNMLIDKGEYLAKPHFSFTLCGG